MNSLTIIGNLTRDPELRVTASGKDVCSFTVAVNRRGDSNEADFFQVTVWDRQAQPCSKYLSKGRKVCVVGPVSVSTYTGNDGNTRATLEVTARTVEFLSGRLDEDASVPESAYTPVYDDDNPFV